MKKSEKLIRYEYVEATMFESIQLSAHVRSSRSFSKQMLFLCRSIQKEYVELSKEAKKVDTYVHSDKPLEASEAFKEFLKIYDGEENLIEKNKHDDFIVMHRMLKQLYEVMEHLSNFDKIELPVDAKSLLHHDVTGIRNILHKIFIKMNEELKKSRDLARNKNRFRDRSLMTNTFLLSNMIVSAKHEYEKSKVENETYTQVLDDVIGLFTRLKKGRVIVDVESRIKTLHNNIRSSENQIYDELVFALKMYDDIIVLQFRLKNLEKKEKIEIHKFLKYGMPDKKTLRRLEKHIEAREHGCNADDMKFMKSLEKEVREFQKRG